jgi:hypothetical protein
LSPESSSHHHTDRWMSLLDDLPLSFSSTRS